jgi:hypothetical protein
LLLLLLFLTLASLSLISSSLYQDGLSRLVHASDAGRSARVLARRRTAIRKGTYSV